MTIQLTQTALKKIFPKAKPAYLKSFVDYQSALDKAGITATRQRLAYFLAQVGHESGGLTITEENMNYSAERMTQVWPSRFKTISAAAPYAHNPKALANYTYGGRMGNVKGTDDGWNYRGSGPIQITGRDGFRNVGALANLPLEMNPDMARDPQYGAAICAAFWTWKKLNPVADKGDFVAVTKKINGGTIGMADRQAWLNKVQPVVDSLRDGETPPPKPVPVPEPKPPLVAPEPKSEPTPIPEVPDEVKEAVKDKVVDTLKKPSVVTEVTKKAGSAGGFFASAAAWFHDHWVAIGIAGVVVVALILLWIWYSRSKKS